MFLYLNASEIVGFPASVTNTLFSDGRMVSHPPLNHNKLRILFQALRILITRGFQILFVKHRITWLVLACGRIEIKFSSSFSLSFVLISKKENLLPLFSPWLMLKEKK